MKSKKGRANTDPSKKKKKRKTKKLFRAGGTDSQPSLMGEPWTKDTEDGDLRVFPDHARIEKPKKSENGKPKRRKRHAVRVGGTDSQPSLREVFSRTRRNPKPGRIGAKKSMAIRRRSSSSRKESEMIETAPIMRRWCSVFCRVGGSNSQPSLCERIIACNHGPNEPHKRRYYNCRAKSAPSMRGRKSPSSSSSRSEIRTPSELVRNEPLASLFRMKPKRRRWCSVTIRVGGTDSQPSLNESVVPCGHAKNEPHRNQYENQLKSNQPPPRVRFRKRSRYVEKVDPNGNVQDEFNQTSVSFSVSL